jgi:serine phosphatase RsbU (regulator of sigma subunit)
MSIETDKTTQKKAAMSKTTNTITADRSEAQASENGNAKSSVRTPQVAIDVSTRFVSYPESAAVTPEETTSEVSTELKLLQEEVGRYQAMKARAVDFLTKPFRDEDFLDAIRQSYERDRVAQRERSEREKELAAAARIQQGLMAVRIPQLPFVRVTGRNLPCLEIGGDFFTAIVVDEQIVAVIADVSGKGIAAAVMASLLQGMIHECLRSRVPLPEIARRANEFFCERDLGYKYATFVIVCLQASGSLEYLNCAHVPPLIARANGEIIRLREANKPVGLLPDAGYESAAFHMSPGDRIVLVTDGVTEAEGPDEDFYGDERLEASVAQGMAPEQILTSVRLFCADRSLSDDCTVLGLDYLAPPIVG